MSLSLSLRPGVLGWVSQGLNNILPQPEEKYRESPGVHNEEETEVRFSLFCTALIVFPNIVWRCK